MSSYRLVLFALLMIVLISLSLLPLRRGQQLNCGDKLPERARVVGFPISAYESSGEKYKVCVPTGPSSEIGPLTSNLSTAAVWFDLIINGAVILGAYFLLDSRKVKK